MFSPIAFIEAESKLIARGQISLKSMSAYLETKVAVHCVVIHARYLHKQFIAKCIGLGFVYGLKKEKR